MKAQFGATWPKIRASYARYYSQRGTSDLSSTYNTVGATYVEFPWNDKNKDQVVQMNEVTSYTLLSSGGNYNAADPANPVSPNKVDPNIKNEADDEFLVGFDKQVGPDIGVSASYIYRKYNNIRTTYYYNSTTGVLLTADNYKQYTYTPDCSTAPAGARCQPVAFWGPVDANGNPANRPTSYIYMNQPDFYRNYNGFEVALRKRMSHRWMANASLAVNSAKRFYTSSAAYQDPTNIDKYNGAQYAQESTSSGLDNVFVNARWVARLTGAYQLPYDIGVAGFYNARGGYPFLPSVNVVSSALRKNDGTIQVLLDPLGDVRLPKFQTVDLPPGQDLQIPSGPLPGGHGRVQPHELEHGAVAEAEPERVEREHDFVDPGAARPALRREGHLLGRDRGSSRRRSGGGSNPAPLSCTPGEASPYCCTSITQRERRYNRARAGTRGSAGQAPCR